MDEPKVSRVVTVSNPQGLHARPADLFVRLAKKFSADVVITKNGGEPVDGKSILSILSLGAGPGTELEIGARGHDADAALSALAELVEQGFAAEEQSSNLNQEGNQPC